MCVIRLAGVPVGSPLQIFEVKAKFLPFELFKFFHITTININVFWVGCYVINRNKVVHHCEVEGKGNMAFKDFFQINQK